MMKIIDIVVFAILGYIAYHYYHVFAASQNIFHALAFDLVSIAAALYAMFRNRHDINIVSLITAVLLFKPVNMAIMFSSACSHGLAYYPLMIMLNAYTMMVIWMRPVIFSNFGPLKKHKEGWRITKADDTMTIILTLMILFDLALLIEQILRFAWPTITVFYDMYEILQVVFAASIISVFYFMATSSQANEQSTFRHIDKS